LNVLEIVKKDPIRAEPACL